MRACDPVMVGVVRVEYGCSDSGDNVSCQACSWGVAVGPRELAMLVAGRHNARHPAAPPLTAQELIEV